MSLNAAIEAARVGASGRGFAVVADNIKQMSDDTANEVNEIKKIIKGLVDSCSECIESANSMISNNAEQKKEIQSVIHEFSTLDSEIIETTKRIKDIVGLIDKEGDTCTSLAANSEELSAISENNAASSEEMNANVEELNAMMHSVEDNAKSLSEKAIHMDKALEFFK